jgi:hypothetical protein
MNDPFNFQDTELFVSKFQFYPLVNTAFITLNK